MFNNRDFESALNQAVEGIRRDQPETARAEEAARRVWNRLVDETAAAEPADLGQRITGCSDIQALLPAYRAGKLPQAREWLVQDHLRECANCRVASEGARKVVTMPWRGNETVRHAGMTPARRFAWAAAMFVCVGSAAWFYRDSFLPAPAGERASLEWAEGPVYLVSTAGQRALKAGDNISEKEWVRTANGSRAILKLRDGSRVEMNERAELGVSMNRQDTRVHLERGAIIVQAAKRRSGHLTVHVPDATVAVTGTVFSVNRGMKGSRVSVIEGAVEVDQRGNRNELRPGDQITTSQWLQPVAVKDEVAWSRNAAEHLKLLEQMKQIAREVESIRLPGLRYSSRILGMLPRETVFYVALPNLGETLEKAHEIFRNRVQQSPELAAWWEKRGRHEGEPALEDIVRFVRGATDYLGDEVVLAAVQDAAGKPDFAIVAEIRRQGLREYLEANLQKFGVKQMPEMLLTDSLVVFSPDPDLLRQFSMSGTLAGDAFGRRIAEAYNEGVSILFCADLSRLAGAKGTPAGAGLSSSGVRYLVIEQRQNQRGIGETRADLSFSGAREGFASWLAEPGPMGALDFVPGGATFAAGFVVKRPELIVEDILKLGNTGKSSVRSDLGEVEKHLGFRVREDLAAALGNDVAIAVAGPIFPPAWIAAIEVNDPARVQQIIDKFVAEYNRNAAQHDAPAIVTGEPQPNGGASADPRQVRTLQFGKSGLEVRYTFSDGYFVAAADAQTLNRALRAKNEGGRRVRFSQFLPTDRYPNFSAVIYHDLSRVGSVIADLAAASNLAEEQRLQIARLAGDAKPGLVYAYAENDRIRVASAGGFFGMSLENLMNSAGISQILHQHPAAKWTQSGQMARKLERGEGPVAPKPPRAPVPPRPEQ